MGFLIIKLYLEGKSQGKIKHHNICDLTSGTVIKRAHMKYILNVQYLVNSKKIYLVLTI